MKSLLELKDAEADAVLCGDDNDAARLARFVSNVEHLLDGEQSSGLVQNAAEESPR